MHQVTTQSGGDNGSYFEWLFSDKISIDYFHKLKVGRNKEGLDPKMSTGMKIKTNLPKGTSESRSFKVGNICFEFDDFLEA